MRKFVFFIRVLFVQISLFAQEYYPEGTRWTEIRLDTLKYDNWYSKAGDKWIPNFETVTYYVKGKHDNHWTNYWNDYTCVYSDGPEWTDSLTLMISESVNENDYYIGATTPNLVEEFAMPGTAYQMKWYVGKELYYSDIIESNITSTFSEKMYGVIEEIKEGYFGGEKLLKYVDLSSVRIIQGIGVTEWKSGECLFGPINPYKYSFYPQLEPSEVRRYRSMLVHFERNGEVLYDIWPDKVSSLNDVHSPQNKHDNTIYNLQGLKVVNGNGKGIYIKNGKKVTIK